MFVTCSGRPSYVRFHIIPATTTVTSGIVQLLQRSGVTSVFIHNLHKNLYLSKLCDCQRSELHGHKLIHKIIRPFWKLYCQNGDVSHKKKNTSKTIYSAFLLYVEKHNIEGCFVFKLATAEHSYVYHVIFVNAKEEEYYITHGSVCIEESKPEGRSYIEAKLSPIKHTTSTV